MHAKFLSVHSSLCRVGVLVCFFNFFFPLVSFHGDSVKNILRFLSCLFTICRPAKCSVRPEKVFVVVFFPSGKQTSWSQTREKPAGIESQVKGLSGSVAEEQTFLSLPWILQGLLTGFHTQHGIFPFCYDCCKLGSLCSCKIAGLDFAVLWEQHPQLWCFWEAGDRVQHILPPPLVETSKLRFWVPWSLWQKWCSLDVVTWR